MKGSVQVTKSSAMDVQSLMFPFEIHDVEPDLAKELMEHYTGEKTGFVQVGPKRYFLGNLYKQQAASIYNMPIRPDDVFVHSFPRSGTTITQELVWLIQNNLDYERAKSTYLFERFPLMEYSIFLHPEMIRTLFEENDGNKDLFNNIGHYTTPCAEFLAKFPSPRFIKTHMPLSLLPPKLLDSAKMVYVARDPRDVMISMYFLCRLARPLGAVKDFDTHWHYFIKGLVYWGPYFENVKEAWNMRNHPNLLFIFYEDLVNDMPAVIRRVAAFFGKSYTDQQIEELCIHLSFDKFKTNQSISIKDPNFNYLKNDEAPFIRRGKIGGWRDYLDEEMQQQTERWMADNLRDTDLRFPIYNKNN